MQEMAATIWTHSPTALVTKFSTAGMPTFATLWCDRGKGAASSAAPHTRMGFSNFGNRVDCYAWGENVDTCSSNSTGSTTLYTGTFSDTSSASPIVTGAALVVQGVAEANLGYRFSPHQVRVILSDAVNGTTSNNPSVDRIGVMPDLRVILQNNVLNLAPDVYIRDFVGDLGEPHTRVDICQPRYYSESCISPQPTNCIW